MAKARIGRRVTKKVEEVVKAPVQQKVIQKKEYNLEEDYNLNKELLYDVFLKFREKFKDITIDSDLGEIKVFSSITDDSINFTQNSDAFIEDKILYVTNLFNNNFDDLVLETLGRNDYAQVTAYSFEQTGTTVIKHYFKN
jgi:hypothetical protein